MQRIANSLYGPSLMKSSLEQNWRFRTILASWLRLIPDFIIIGGQRCGSTSLYNYIIKHPGVVPSLKKEVHFFDLHFEKGLAWYRAHFSLLLSKYYTKHICKREFVTGEASPYYLFHPLVPRRILETIPTVKLIVLLRNPIDRAYSQYHHSVRQGIEPLSFEDAIEKEESRLQGETEKIINNENYDSFNHRKFSYISRGIYINQLKKWNKLFPQEQILTLKSEDFYANPPKVLRKVFEFLNLSNWELSEYKKYNLASYPNMDKRLRERLLEYFAPYNQELSQFLEMDFDDWNR